MKKPQCLSPLVLFISLLGTSIVPLNLWNSTTNDLSRGNIARKISRPIIPDTTPNISTVPAINEVGLARSVHETIGGYRGIKVGIPITTSRFRVGVIEHYIILTPILIERHIGVYSRLFPYYQKDYLASGDAGVSSDTVVETELRDELTITYSENYRYEVESKMNASANISFSGLNYSAEMSTRSSGGVSYTRSESYSRRTKKTFTYRETNKLTSASASKCPDGYSMSVGTILEYYTIAYKWSEYEIWFNNHVITGNNENILGNALISDESKLVTTYIFLKTYDYKNLYYLP